MKGLPIPQILKQLIGMVCFQVWKKLHFRISCFNLLVQTRMRNNWPASSIPAKEVPAPVNWQLCVHGHSSEGEGSARASSNCQKAREDMSGRRRSLPSISVGVSTHVSCRLHHLHTFHTWAFGSNLLQLHVFPLTKEMSLCGFFCVLSEIHSSSVGSRWIWSVCPGPSNS